jgi:protein gp37
MVMAVTSKIEWCDATFNGWIGCQHVSPGCDHCYAETQNSYRRWSADGAWGPHAERRRTSPANWKNPPTWNADAPRFEREHGRRRRVFSASLSDWLDNRVPREWRADLCRLIEETPNLDWLMLTKRIENYRKLAPQSWQDNGPPPNVWLGATTETAEYYQKRWPILAGGALGKLDLGVGTVPNWIIIGGESGPKARVMNPQWAREIRDQCKPLEIALFLKQWGTYASNPLVWEDRNHFAQVLDPASNGKGGALLDGRLWREFPSPSSSALPAIACPLGRSEARRRISAY